MTLQILHIKINREIKKLNKGGGVTTIVLTLKDVISLCFAAIILLCIAAIGIWILVEIIKEKIRKRFGKK